MKNQRPIWDGQQHFLKNFSGIKLVVLLGTSYYTNGNVVILNNYQCMFDCLLWVDNPCDTNTLAVLVSPHKPAGSLLSKHYSLPLLGSKKIQSKLYKILALFKWNQKSETKIFFQVFFLIGVHLYRLRGRYIRVKSTVFSGPKHMRGTYVYTLYYQPGRSGIPRSKSSSAHRDS